MTEILRSRADFLSARAAIGDADVGAVLTMGALHDGHSALLRAARSASDVVVATVFVNPAQFGPSEDLVRYPRTLDADVGRCRDEGVDVVWAPDVTDVYPRATTVSIDPGELGRELEGVSRPGHFAGMLLVVGKLLHLVAPRRAYFGEKDWQQLTLVRAMVADLELPTLVEAVPTVREPDGLALSSRNVYLDADQRAAAAALPRALFAGRAAATNGASGALAAAARVLDAAPGLQTEYLELRSPELGPAPANGPARLLVAAQVGATRLIDNVGVELGSHASDSGRGR